MSDGPEFVSFGELMLRLSPPGNQRFQQASSFDACFGGGEANVAVSLAQFGADSRFASAIPNNEIGEAAMQSLRSWGIDTTCVTRSGDRLGVYFLEHGASQRPSQVIYDRKGSAISEADAGGYDWKSILDGAKWFHFTGITPALSSATRQAVEDATKTAKSLGLTVSCDLNYRGKLWSKEEAREVMTKLMKQVDVLFANEEDCQSVFGIACSGVHSGEIDRERYIEISNQLIERFRFRSVAISLRESHSASRNGWSGLLVHGGDVYFGKRYEIDIVDRVGSGDAFAAGVIYGFLRGMDPQHTIEFGVAAGCLKHSVPGDFNVATVADIETLLKSGGSGRVVR